MQLYELTYACRLYEIIGARYDASYNDMRGVLGAEPDLATPEQRNAILIFLNAWGCRIPGAYFPAIQERLQRWAALWLPRLPATGRNLPYLTPAERDEVGEAYAALLELGAGLRFSHTAAAKTLLAVRQLPPWDSAILGRFAENGPEERRPARLYSDFLGHVANELDELQNDVNRLNLNFDDIPRFVGRCYPIVKLIDEVYWIRDTLGHAVPTRLELQQWLDWSPAE